MSSAMDDPTGRHGGPDWSSPWDDALQRLETVLAHLPESRALPPLDEIIAEADLPPEYLHEDDRARKLLHEALAARPLSSVTGVAKLRTEVELLTLEVEVLADRLRSEDTDPVHAREAAERIEGVRTRLEEISRLL
jgi:hypothetical protein